LATAETTDTPFVPAGITLAEKVGCSSQTAQCLRTVAASTLVEQEPSIEFPIIDGTVLNQNLDSAFATGQFNRVSLINGTNHDEWRLFVAETYGASLTDADDKYQNAVAKLLGMPVSSTVVQAVLSEYPLSNYPPPQGYSVSAPLALGAVGTDWFFVCTARKADLSLSKYVPTYTYEFNDETAPSFFPPGALNFPLGDSHFIEVQYLFNFGTPFNSDQQQLSDTMIGYWTQFAKTGNPNFEGAASWPVYTGAGGNFQSLIAPMPTPPKDSTESDADFDTFHKCSSFWDSPAGQ
jgi:para-nitrobenzyl esterase